MQAHEHEQHHSLTNFTTAYYYMCPHTNTKCVFALLCKRTNMSNITLLPILPLRTTMCVLILLLNMCPHATVQAHEHEQHRQKVLEKCFQNKSRWGGLSFSW